MKRVILVVLLAVSFGAKAQTLKELLYSGKLKNDSGSVVRKTDDLKSKIDTSQKKIAEPEKSKTAVKPATVPGDSSVKTVNTQTDATVASGDTTAAVATNTVTATEPVATTAAPAKTNTKIWKEYSEALATSLKTEVLNSKKIKKDTYFFMAEYELDPSGQVNITNVTVTPENSLLAAQVKQRMETTPPQLNADPNQTKKVKRRYSFSVTKD